MFQPLPTTLPTQPVGGTQQLAMFDLGPTQPIQPTSPVLPPSSGDYRAVVDVEGLNALLAELRAAPAFAFDTEASGLRPFECDIVGISFCVQPGTAYYLPIGHREGQQLDKAQALEAVRPLFEDPRWGKYAHNAKFDIEVLLHAGITVHGLAFDTMIAAGLLGKTPGLKELSFYELKLNDAMTPIEDLIGRGNKQITFDKVPIEQATPYAAADADMTMRLVLALQPQLAEEPRINDIFQRLEMPLVDVLVHMEEAGIGLDVSYITQLGERLGARISEIEQTIYSFNNGEKFNINSGDQLSDVLFEKLGISAEGVGRTAKTKKYSLTAETLENIRDRHPIFEQIMLYRQLTKLKSTYVDSIPGLVDPTNGRVRTVYNQMGSATGRLSSNDPNLQNIPIRTQEGKEIRKAFIAAPGHCFIAADYSQIELRVMAHFAKDPNLIEVFEKKQDIHAATASQLFGVEMHNVDKNQRRIAKCVAAGTLVATEQGIVPIEALGLAEPGEVSKLQCVVAQEGSQRALATGFYNGGVQPTLRITTERGYVLEATAKHKVRSIDLDGSYIWSELGQLTVGEYVALARGTMLFGNDNHLGFVTPRRNDKKSPLPEQLTPEFARFLGYYVAEGNTTTNHSSKSVIINNKDPEVIEDLCKLSAIIFGRPPRALVDKNGVTRLSWHSSKLSDLLTFLGIGDGAANKCIPDVIMRASYESVTEFLRAFFEGDGSISESYISAGSKSYALIQQLQTLLLNLGIVAYLEHRDIPNYGRHYKLRIIGRESHEHFATHIGFVSSRKQSRLLTLVEKTVTNEPVLLPHQVHRLMRMYPKTNRDLKEAIHMCIRTKSPTVGLTYRRLDVITKGFPDRDDADLHALLDHQERNIFYDRIVSIEQSTAQVYDLVVPENNTYIANGFVSHNTIVFGVIYGISAFGLSQRLHMERATAQTLINELFARFPGIRRYIDETLERGRRDGYVSTLFGRKRRMDALRASGPQRQAAEREAINAPIQGTAADIMKIAMINVANALKERQLKTRLLLQVHDELILEAPEDEVETAKQLLCEVMENAYKLEVEVDGVKHTIPLEVGVETGTNWGEMTE
jgi:DNA polymerase I-like protein with 3'-5' exonuclease and polymerase domains/intein/homing endonuclease